MNPDDNTNPLLTFWKDLIEKQLQVELSNANILLVDGAHHDANSKVNLIKLFLEDLKVNSINIMNSATLSLFSTGATRGFVIEVGHGVTTTTPIFEGYLLKHALHTNYCSGDTVVKYLEKVLHHRPHPRQHQQRKYLFLPVIGAEGQGRCST